MSGTDQPLTSDELLEELEQVLEGGERDDRPFDRSWVVRNDDGVELMVELTRLASGE